MLFRSCRKIIIAAYLYVSEDYGKQWTRIGTDLPLEPVNVVREDPVNPNLLYVGTDHGVYISLDRGQSFSAVSEDFPAVPVHDLAIQNQAKDLVIGTHGRSIYKMPVGQLQQMTEEVMLEPLYVFDLKKTRFAKGWGKKTPWNEPKDPELPVVFYTATAGKVDWSVKLKDGPEIQRMSVEAKKGMNKLVYNLSIRPDALKTYTKKMNDAVKDPKKMVDPQKADTGNIYLQKGTYIFIIEQGGKTAQKEFVIE